MWFIEAGTRRINFPAVAQKYETEGFNDIRFIFDQQNMPHFSLPSFKIPITVSRAELTLLCQNPSVKIDGSRRAGQAWTLHKRQVLPIGKGWPTLGFSARRINMVERRTGTLSKLAEVTRSAMEKVSKRFCAPQSAWSAAVQNLMTRGNTNLG